MRGRTCPLQIRLLMCLDFFILGGMKPLQVLISHFWIFWGVCFGNINVHPYVLLSFGSPLFVHWSYQCYLIHGTLCYVVLVLVRGTLPSPVRVGVGLVGIVSYRDSCRNISLGHFQYRINIIIEP